LAKLLITTNPLWLFPAASLGSWEKLGAGKSDARGRKLSDFRQVHKQNSKIGKRRLSFPPSFPPDFPLFFRRQVTSEALMTLAAIFLPLFG